ncbi:malto-oligosyltrehalose synthase [Croceibacterium sp. TMG7-5b_MA50]|uniref:malto-oligosyltrehalose synthase n=1 Tax=Croceibacterium sp. TMG7-5b_MA50 TaxID=3121290 RepID=UPI00322193EB
MSIPRATYRLQLHRDFPFSAAEAIVPYLHDLGISHVYASPITTAVAGSMHGYDVTDPTRVNPELGGEDGLRSLVAALRAHGMGLIIDIVPNHMGIAGGENSWWQDVLRNGEASRYARFFDIDWTGGKPLLPILGARLEDVLAEGQITVDRDGAEPALLLYGEQRVPIRAEDHGDLPADGDIGRLRALLDRQHYQLAWWRTADDELNWRRFFTVSELAGLRVEDPEVFEETHALYFRLYAEGLVDGLRVDHVDGLADPGTYCRMVRERLEAIQRPADAPAGPAYLVVEKILGAGEKLPTSWQVDGTSGYDFMEEVSALLHDPAGEAPLTALWHEFSGRDLTWHQEELLARQQLLSWSFDAQFRACADLFADLAAARPESRGWTTGMMRRAIERLLWVFPVYRTYRPRDNAPTQDAMLDRVRAAVKPYAPPGEAEVVEQVLQWLVEPAEGDRLLQAARRRFWQLSAPIAAKAVEDTGFYRYCRLLSRTDVGFDAGRWSQSAEEFHAGNAERAEHFPHAMLATATHDHKRGEDVRARLAVLSGVPDLWRQEVTGWDWLAGGEGTSVDPADRYALWQTLFGAWPAGLNVDDADGRAAFAERVNAWQQKALREGKLRSSWEAPDEAYEQVCADLVTAVLTDDRHQPLVRAIAAFVDRVEPAFRAVALVQMALRLTVPGMPDTYQGTEREDLSLVDPDNRRPVDYTVREMGGHWKGDVLRRLLHLRRDHPAMFTGGGYQPVEVSGAKADHVLAFRREGDGEALMLAFALHCSAAIMDGDGTMPSAEWWGDTRIGELPAAEAFAGGPVHVAPA